jgi:hypothetical protein
VTPLFGYREVLQNHGQQNHFETAKDHKEHKDPLRSGAGQVGDPDLELFASRHHGALHDVDESGVVVGEIGGK